MEEEFIERLEKALQLVKKLNTEKYFDYKYWSLRLYENGEIYIEVNIPYISLSSRTLRDFSNFLHEKDCNYYIKIEIDYKGNQTANIHITMNEWSFKKED